MNEFEAYQLNNALRLHFTSKYDFFKYSGKTKANIQTYNKLSQNEKFIFANVAALKEPKLYLVGNYIFNETKFIRHFDNEHYLHYRQFITNGEYSFKNDLGKLKKPFGTNFRVENDSEIPYIIQLLMREEISLFTACVTRKLMDWTQQIPTNVITSNSIEMINKSFRFFKIDTTTYKKLVLESNK